MAKFNSSSSSRSHLALIAMLIASASWAMAFTWVPIALHIIDPLPLSAMRFVSAGFIALIWISWKRPPLPAWGDVTRYLIASFFGSFCYSVFVNIGQGTVSPGAASFITNIIPILTAILAWIALGERLNFFGWIGCLLSFGGVTYIALDQPGGVSFGSGAMFIFLASLAASIYFIIQKRLIETYGAMPCTAYTLVFSGLLLVPWFPQAILQSAQANSSEAIAVGGLILFPTMIAYVGSLYALSQLPAGITTSSLYLIAPLATIFAFVILGDVPSIATIVGGFVAIIGTIIVAVWGRVN